MERSYARLCFSISLAAATVILSIFAVMSDSFYSIDQGDNQDALLVLSHVKGEGQLLVDMTPEERSHLSDVRQIIFGIKVILAASIIVMAVILRQFDSKPAALRLAGIIVVCISVLLAVGSLAFNTFFEIFHKALFKPGTYMFEQNSVLISLFPLDYFQHSFLAIVVTCGIAGLALFAVGTKKKSSA